MVRPARGQPGAEFDPGQRGLAEAGQVADRVEGGHRGPVEQELAVQGGAVQRPQAQPARGHARAFAVW